ncbi:MAG: arylsulfatase, partial [Acidimicrobiales bacterium]
ARSQPNIVFMLLDNLGYGDPGCYGGGVTRMAPTPRVDRLAAEGLRLTNFNVEAECTPTRAALMTGRMPVRSGCDRVRFGGKNGLAPWEYTMSQMLKDVGYSTAIYGKWHLGNVPDRHPTAMGFDQWYGIQDSTDPVFDFFLAGKGIRARTTKVWEAVAGSPAVTVGDYSPEARRAMDAEVTDRACRYITENAGRDNPFFLYVPFTMIHHPALPHADFAGVSGNGDFADCMIEVDHYTGRIIDAVDAAGIAEDTIVVWASDNGPPAHGTLGPQGDPGPFRGCLGTAYEGQLRTACIIRWPARIEPGRVSDGIVSVMDFFVTFAKIVGGRVPEDRAIDSMDIGPLLAGTGPSPREWLICYVRDTLAAFKWHQYKVHLVEFGMEPGKRYKLDLEFPQMYNVASDPKEQWDILGTNLWAMEVVRELMADFHRSVARFPHVPRGADAPPAPTAA